MFRRIMLTAAFAVLLLAALTGCTGTTPESPAATTPASAATAAVTAEASATTQPISTVPPPSPTATAQPSATPTPGESHPKEVRIDDFHARKDGDVWFISALVNNYTASDILNPVLELVARDADGQVVARQALYPSHIIPAGFSYPFGNMLYPDKPIPDDAVWELTVQSYEATAHYEEAQLEIRKVSVFTNTYGSIVVTGELANTGAEDADLDTLYAALYSPDGRLFYASSNWVTVSTYPAGYTAPFRVEIVAPSGFDVTEMEVQAGAIASVDSFGIPVYDYEISEVTFFVDDYGRSVSAIGEVHNPSSTRIPPYTVILAGAYAEDGTVLDVARETLPLPVMPGGKMPFSVTAWLLLSSNPALRGQVAYIKAQLATDLVTSGDTSTYLNLETSGEGLTYDGTVATVRGTVTNNSGETVDHVTAIIELHHPENGQLLCLNYSSLEGLADGSSLDFEEPVYCNPPFSLSTLDVTVTAVGEIY